MGRTTVLGLAALALMSAGAASYPSTAAAQFQPQGEVAPSSSPAGAEPARFGAVGEFSFTTSEGEPLTQADLAGAPWVATLFFTSCSGPCPRLMADVRTELHDQLADTSAKIVSFTVDPDTDDAATLREYADNLDLDPERWLFATGDERELHRFIQEQLKLAVAPAPAPEELSETERLTARLEATHATKLVVVDAAGQIAGFYECAGEKGELHVPRDVVEASFARLVGRVEALSRPRSVLPLVNASLNGLAGVLLILGFLAIKRGRKERHAALMRLAFVVSAGFLASYVYYHTRVIPLSGGPTRFNGEGAARLAYLILLATHVILAMINLPMVLMTLWLAHKERWDRHRRLARVTFPIWLYVSVTGVLVYLVLYPLNPPAA